MNFVFIYFLAATIVQANEAEFWKKAAQQGRCQQKTPVSLQEIKSHVRALDPSNLESISRKLIAESASIPARCKNPDRIAATKCALGEDGFDRLVYLLDKYNINASHLQTVPIVKDGQPHSRVLKRERIKPFESSQLDILIMAARDVSPHLIPKNQSLSIMRTDIEGVSGSYVNYYDRPVIELNSDDDRLKNLEDKIMIVHEICHVAADHRGQLDQSDEWLSLDQTINQKGVNLRLLTSRKITMDEFIKRDAAFKKNIEGNFASSYGTGSVQEDFAETCVAHRYGVIEGSKPATDRLKAKLKFVAQKLFSGASFDSCPPVSAPGGTPRSQPAPDPSQTVR